YVRSPYMGTTTYKYQIDNQTWTPIASNNLMSYVQCCGGLDYFPEMNGVIWVQGGEVGNTGGVFLLSDSTGQWSRVGKIHTYVMGSYHNFAEYNPVYKVVLFGGGNDGARKLYKLSSNGTITSLKDAPVDLGIQSAMLTVDSVSGDYLVFSN